MTFPRLALAAIALNIVITTQAQALNVARINQIINEPINTDRPFTEHAPLSGHTGLSIDVELSRGSETSWWDRNSTSQETTFLRYTIAFGVPASSSRDCDLSWGQTARVAATAVVWSLSNRLIRGDSDYGGQIPGGATFWGMTIPWMFTAAMHDDLSYGQAAGHIAADVFSEQIAGWSSALDMGYSSELPADHWAHNPGNRYEDQMAMTAHLYRAKALSLAMLKHRYGEVDPVALASPALGGIGYQAGRYLGEEGVTPEWDDESFQGKMFGAKPYRIGELAMGAAYGVGVARSVECAR